MRFLRGFLNTHRALVVSVGAISLYSATLAFAVQVAPGTVLDPAGLPGAYTVGPVLSYGEAVTTSHDNEILYIDGNGDLISDDSFTRDSNQETVIGKESGTQTYGFFLNNDFGLGGLEASLIGMDSSDDSLGLVGVVDASLSGGGPQSPFMTYIDDLGDPNNSMSVVTLGNDGSGNSIFALQTTNVNANTHFYSNNTGNEIAWDADTTDDLQTSIIQGQDLLGYGIAGSGMLFKDTVTGELAGIITGDLTGLGGRPFYASLLYQNPSVLTASISAQDTGLSSAWQHTDVDIQGYWLMNDSGNSLSWDADTTDDIQDVLIQGNNLNGVGIKGNALAHSNTSTFEAAAFFAGDTTTVGGNPYEASMTYVLPGGINGAFTYTVNDDGLKAEYYDIVGNIKSQILQEATGNTISWDADTTDDIQDQFIQGQNLLGNPIKGNLILHRDTVTDEMVSMFVGDLTGVAQSPWSAGFTYSGTNTLVLNVMDDGGVRLAYSDSGLNINNSLRITDSENTLSFDADTTDDVIDQIQMTTNVGGFGLLDGIGILRTDSNLGINTGLFVGDASGLGLATMTSYLSAGSLLAAVDQNKFYAGDLLMMGNGTMMRVDDSDQKIKFNTGGQFIVVDSTDGELFEIDAATLYMQLGDIGAGGNSTLFTVDDANQIITISAAGSASAVFAVTNSDGTCTLDPGDVSGLACPSDENLKKEITTLQDGALSNILALRPVTYRLKKETETSPLSTGLIAQEVQSIFPTLVKTQMDGTLSLNYGGLTPFIIKAIQELNMKVTAIADLTEESGIREALRTWFSDTANGITELFAGRIKTNELCVGSVCVTESEFLQLVQQSGQNQTSFSGGTSTEDGSTSETETNTDTGESGTETPEASSGYPEQTSTPENPPAPEPTETI